MICLNAIALLTGAFLCCGRVSASTREENYRAQFLSAKPPSMHTIPQRTVLEHSDELPEQFDARTKWALCAPLIEAVYEQSNCDSSWAFSTAATISDRICIHSGGEVRVAVSAADLLSCCPYCGGGCSGGAPGAAWSYWVQHGVVTGGGYNASAGCYDYPIPPCTRNCTRPTATPKCPAACANGADISASSHVGGEIYAMSMNERLIMQEIHANGPVQSGVNVYSDFFAFSGSGVYVHTKGIWMGSQYVKIFGWGVEGGQKYWLAVNSWGPKWGDKGLFKILRGVNHCGIEEELFAGLPKDGQSSNSTSAPNYRLSFSIPVFIGIVAVAREIV